MEQLTIYEAGARNQNGKYTQFVQSNELSKVDEYLEIMKKTIPDGFEIVRFEKTYELISTTPHIVSR